MHNSDIHKEIRAIEREMEQVKLLQRLGKIEFSEAKDKLRDLDVDLIQCVKKLPEYDKHLYMIKREFGDIE
jgi:septation ring formation regulator EzrA